MFYFGILRDVEEGGEAGCVYVRVCVCMCGRETVGTQWRGNMSKYPMDLRTNQTEAEEVASMRRRASSPQPRHWVWRHISVIPAPEAETARSLGLTDQLA